jgi:hypothetical protein
MAYELEGRLLEVCNCEVLCPCWIGEMPDNGTCDAVVAYHIDRGNVDDVDVSGHTFALISHIPGNVLDGNWKVVVFIDDGASLEQRDAILNAFTGKLGGPLADVAQLVGEVVAVESVPISFRVDDGKGTLKIGSVVDSEMAPYLGPTGEVTTLNESVFSTIPGSPAYVAKASHYKRNSEQYGLKDLSLQGHNAIQGTFQFEALTETEAAATEAAPA